MTIAYCTLWFQNSRKSYFSWAGSFLLAARFNTVCNLQTLYPLTPSCQARCSYCWNGGTALLEVNYWFPIGFEVWQEEIHALSRGPGSKSYGCRGHRHQQWTYCFHFPKMDISSNFLQSIYIYINSPVLPSVLIKDTSLCHEWWINAETHHWLRSWGQVTDDMKQPCPHFTDCQVSESITEDGEEQRSHMMRRDLWTHSCCVSLDRVYTTLSWQTFSHR